MEKLSIEEKAQAYDKALERAQALYNDKNEIGYANAESVLEEVFPLLKESEDEKIRKFLIKWIQDNYYHGTTEIPTKTLIAWLEKQKPADKVEPKFKVGDWITDDEAIFHITSYDINYGYQLETVNGTSFHYSDETIEKKYRLWTIQDAKQGDVLYHKAENGIEYIVMNKGLNENNNVDSYFRYSSINGFNTDIPSVLSAKCDSITPATKEQRDFLFQKMKEDGYEWDSEKKELKEIDNVTLTAWSEEDKKMIGRIRSIVEKYAFSESAVDVNGELCEKEHIDVDNWLKSLKQRYTWKPSDEQLEFLQKCIEAYNGVTFPTEVRVLSSLYNDLKKLREE